MRILLFTIFLSACAYNPIIDTNGRSGTMENTRAEFITSDLIDCKTLAKQETSTTFDVVKVAYNYYFRAFALYLPQKAEYAYPSMFRKCLQQRGHSVVN